ncbi:MAG: phosphatase PAP2 family protein [Candidatus Zixiibacteriota bacterium]|nr:MAG: phosphatase PAP2 family protein [candidate division Zixibacteria bacterium]
MRATPISPIPLLIIILICGCFVGSPLAQEYIGGGEIAAIGSGSAGVAVAGWMVLNVDSSRAQLIGGPLPLERKLQRLLGGSYYEGKSNFLDNSFGSVATPLVAGVALLTADMCWPQGDKSKTILQDFFLYSTGLMTTSGLTDLAKGLIARERPMLSLYPENNARHTDANKSYNRHSFFSGHTSGAFFAASFANIRIRSIMRSEITPSEYRRWRWLPPTLLYGWAGFVGWSRIHAYKHFVSDVLVGATVGYLVAELFYHFGNGAYSALDGEATPMMISINFKF